MAGEAFGVGLANELHGHGDLRASYPTGPSSSNECRFGTLYLTDHDRIALLAANAGNDRIPAWWLNLRAAQTVEILIRGRRRQMCWREADGEGYDRLFAAMVDMYPPAEHYVGFTERRLPVVVLDN